MTPVRPHLGRAFPLAVALVVSALAPAPRLLGQQPDIAGDPSPDAGLGVPLAEPAPITPGGAFLRSVLVPGWGHAVTESYGRAGFYVAAQAGSLWMLVQTVGRHGLAKDALRVEREVARQRALASIEPVDPPMDPEDKEAREEYAAYLDQVTAAIDSDPDVERGTALVDSRDQQVEDWAALSIFLVLLSATDAFVASHLADYPDPLSLDVRPGASGGAEVSVSVPLGISR